MSVYGIGVDIVDLSIPFDLIRLSRVNGQLCSAAGCGHNKVHTLSVNNGFLYTADNATDVIKITDVSNPSSPVVVKSLDIGAPGGVASHEVYARNNDTLRDMLASGRYPELAIADWASYAHDRPQWFSSDGIHMSRRGAYAAADYISRKMAFLEGRACPNPSTPGGTIADPCPDLDATGPINDIDRLYPVNTASPDGGLGLVRGSG